MSLPPNDSPLWPLAKQVVVAIAVIIMATVGTQNGWNWRTDIPALLAILGGLGIVQAAQRTMAPKDDK